MHNNALLGLLETSLIELPENDRMCWQWCDADDVRALTAPTDIHLCHAVWCTDLGDRRGCIISVRPPAVAPFILDCYFRWQKMEEAAG